MDTAPLNALSPTSFPPGDAAPAELDWAVLTDSVGLARPDDLAWAARRAAKRTIDLVGAVVGLTFLLPFLLAIAVWIRVDNPGPVLFRQKRLGRHGRPFWIYKFRTMRVDAEDKLDELESKNESARGVLFKIAEDPRVTRAGHFLRRTNLDEFPQLINVLKGEMSLVGPRPFQLRDCQKLRALDPVAFVRRLELPPGLTGAWQVGRKNPVDSERLLELDLEYVERWSIALDLRLIYRTIFIVIAGLRRKKKG